MKQSFIFGLVVCFILILINVVIAKIITRNFAIIQSVKDKRIILTKQIFQSIKYIKILGWTDLFKKKLLVFREEEQKCLKLIKYLDCFCVFFWIFSSISISVVSLTIYYLQNSNFDNLNILTQLFVFKMIISPLNALPWIVSGMCQSNISKDRICKYL